VINPRSKFDVSSSNVPEIWRGSQNSKVGQVTPFRPVNGGRRWPDIWIPRPRFTSSLYCTFMGLRWRLTLGLPRGGWLPPTPLRFSA